jgi:ACR3 family arsenite efflux pump ArsB
MKKLLLSAKKYLTWSIPFMIVLGLLTGATFNVKPLKALVSPILFVMVFPMMLNVKFKDILEVLKSPRAVMLSVLINFTVAPMLAYGLGKLFLGHDPMLLLGMILIGLIPTSGMTASWTGLAGGKVQTALVMMTVNLLISMVAIPLYLNVFLSSSIAINTISIVVSLLKVVILPLIAASVTRNIIVSQKGAKFFKELKPLFGGVSALGVMAIVWLAIALKAKTILNQPMLALQVMVPLVIFYFVLILIGQAAGRFIEVDGDKAPLVFGTALRNLTIALGMSMSVFGESLAVLLIAIAYVVQLPMAVVYMRHINRQKLTAEEVSA